MGVYCRLTPKKFTCKDVDELIAENFPNEPRRRKQEAHRVTTCDLT